MDCIRRKLRCGWQDISDGTYRNIERSGKMLLGNSFGEEITRNLNVPNSVNNIWLIQGMSGSGKSTFCKNIIKSAAGDGMSVIVIDYSKSYIHKDMPYISDEDYHIIEREGLGIDAFKPKSINIEGYDKKETLSDNG